MIFHGKVLENIKQGITVEKYGKSELFFILRYKLSSYMIRLCIFCKLEKRKQTPGLACVIYIQHMNVSVPVSRKGGP
jgi:hypothetical protein